MVGEYVRATGNSSVLERALPLLHAELERFQINRTMQVTSPYTGKVHRVAHWNVRNSAPRPEGYVEDYETAFGATPPLDEDAR
jgi:alpha,alpha-trehalase